MNTVRDNFPDVRKGFSEYRKMKEAYEREIKDLDQDFMFGAAGITGWRHLSDGQMKELIMHIFKQRVKIKLKTPYVCQVCNKTIEYSDHVRVCQKVNGIHKNIHDMLNKNIIQCIAAKYDPKLCVAESEQFEIEASSKCPDFQVTDSKNQIHYFDLTITENPVGMIKAK